MELIKIYRPEYLAKFLEDNCSKCNLEEKQKRFPNDINVCITRCMNGTNFYYCLIHLKTKILEIKEEKENNNNSKYLENKGRSL